MIRFRLPLRLPNRKSKSMSKFHKTFKNEFILNDDYQGILNGGNKINFKYTSFERGHLKFVGESGILYNICGGDVRDG